MEVNLDRRIFNGVDVKRFQYEEYATSICHDQIDLIQLIGQHLLKKDVLTNCIMINLEKDTQRYDNVVKELKKLSIPNFCHLKGTWWKDRTQLSNDLNFVLDFLKQFIPEIQKKKIEIDDFSFTNDSNIKIQDGPLACYVSHLRAMIYGYVNFSDYLIICEDDVYVANTELITKYLSEVPDDWDIVMLNACSKNRLYDSQLYKFTEDFHSTHFYIIKHSTIPTILRGMYPITDQVDVLISNLRNDLNIYNIQECVYQRNISTNTQNNLWVIFNSPHYDQIRENIASVEAGILNLANLILPKNTARNQIIVQDLMYDVIWNYVLNSDKKQTFESKSLENYDLDLECWQDYPDFTKILDNLRFVLQCCKKGISGDHQAMDILRVIIYTLQKFNLHSDEYLSWSFGSTSHIYLSGNVVIKKYNEKLRWCVENHSNSRDIFIKELKCLTKINEIGLSPNLIEFDSENLMIKTEYCGHSLWDKFELPRDWKNQIKSIFLKLDSLGIFYPEFKLQNILIKDGKITFVDYGLAEFSSQNNSKNLNNFLVKLQKLESRLTNITNRNTRLHLITTFLQNSN